MEAKLRNWFSKKSTTQESSRQRPTVLRGHSYENSSAGQAPVRGEYPVLGTSPYPLQRSRHGQGHGEHEVGVGQTGDDDAAEAPDVPRERSASYSSRPKTAPHNGYGFGNAVSSSARTRSGFSMRVAPNFSKKTSVSCIGVKEKPNSRHISSPQSLNGRPPTAQSSAYTTHTALSQQSSYVDIFDAASSFNPSRRSSASYTRGRRDYGEDVADRNIAIGNSRPDYGEAVAKRNLAEYGGGLESRTWYRSSLSSQASSNNAAAGRDRRGSGFGGSGSVSGSSNWNGHYGGANGTSWVATGGAFSGRTPTGSDDMYPKQDLARYRDSISTTTTNNSFSSPASSLPFQSQHSLSTSAPILTTSPIIGVSTAPSGHENSSRSHPERQPRTRKAAVPPPSTSHISTNPHLVDDYGLAFNIPGQSQYTPPSSSKAYHSSQEDFSNFNTHSSTSSSRYQAPASTSIYPTARQLQQEHKELNSITTAPAIPAIPSRYKHSSSQTLPTPPMSPTSASEASTSSRNKATQDKTLPSPPTGRSRGNSATYTPFPPQYNSNRRSSQPSNAPSVEETSKELAGDPTVRPHPFGGAHKRAGLVIEGAEDPPSLEGIVDLSNTTDTEVITKELPAVVHEHVTPKVHHITQEAVTKEIHHHDVFHRIQPIKQIEVLPTKHYIPHPTMPGQLVEIPESSLPGRKDHFQVVTDDKAAATPAAAALGGQQTNTQFKVVPAHKHAAHMQQEPIKVSERHSVDENGVKKTETVWQHAPRLETGGYETGQTVTLRMNCVPEGAEFTLPARSGKIRDEDLLFKNDGYGAGGMLPGLDEPTPTNNPGTGHGAGLGRERTADNVTPLTKPKQRVRSMLDVDDDDEQVGGGQVDEPNRLRRSKDEWDLNARVSLKGKETTGGGRAPAVTATDREVEELASGVKGMDVR